MSARPQVTGEMVMAGGAVVVGMVCLVNAVASFNGFGTLGVVVLLGAGVAVLAVVGGASSGRFSGGRYVSVQGHAHGSGSSSALRRKIARHEAGHAVAARAVGGSVISATLYAGESGGLVQARLPGDPKAALIFLHAGQAAVSSSEGAGADNDLFRKVAREVPSKDRGRVSAEAKREARRIASSRSGEINSYARKLDERGRL
jgi:hypothetical protein